LVYVKKANTSGIPMGLPGGVVKQHEPAWHQKVECADCVFALCCAEKIYGIMLAAQVG